MHKRLLKVVSFGDGKGIEPRYGLGTFYLLLLLLRYNYIQLNPPL